MFIVRCKIGKKTNDVSRKSSPKINMSTSQVHQNNSNSHAPLQETWNLYSEYADSGQEMSQKKSALWSHSTVKTKPDKYRFPASDPPAIQGLLEYTPIQVYILLLLFKMTLLSLEM